MLTLAQVLTEKEVEIRRKDLAQCWPYFISHYGEISSRVSKKRPRSYWKMG